MDPSHNKIGLSKKKKGMIVQLKATFVFCDEIVGIKRHPTPTIMCTV